MRGMEPHSQLAKASCSAPPSMLTKILLHNSTPIESSPLAVRILLVCTASPRRLPRHDHRWRASYGLSMATPSMPRHSERHLKVSCVLVRSTQSRGRPSPWFPETDWSRTLQLHNPHDNVWPSSFAISLSTSLSLLQSWLSNGLPGDGALPAVEHTRCCMGSSTGGRGTMGACGGGD